MAWSELGSVKLSYKWQLLSIQTIGETVRLRQTWVNRARGKAFIAQVYGDPHEFYGIRAFYPTTDLKILELPIPKDFLGSPISRYLALKLYSRTKVVDFDWQVSVDIFHA